MMIVIRCTHCDKETSLHVEFKVTYQTEDCKACHNHKRHSWTFHFCDHDCFSIWYRTNEVADRGVPCRSCRDTGYAHGFKENGVCGDCKGNKRVKV